MWMAGHGRGCQFALHSTVADHKEYLVTQCVVHVAKYFCPQHDHTFQGGYSAMLIASGRDIKGAIGVL